MIKDTINVPKSILCDKIIDEANRAIQFLNAIRAYASAVALEDLKKQSTQNKSESPLEDFMLPLPVSSEQFFNDCVLHDSKWTSDNSLLPFKFPPEVLAKSIRELLKHVDIINFPKEMFSEFLKEEEEDEYPVDLDDEDIANLKIVLQHLGMPDEVIKQYVVKSKR